VVGLIETVKGRPVHAEQSGLPVRHIEPVEIDQQAHHAVAEAMALWFEARMHDLAEVKRRTGVGYGVTGFGFGGSSAHGESGVPS